MCTHRYQVTPSFTDVQTNAHRRTIVATKGVSCYVTGYKRNAQAKADVPLVAGFAGYA